VSLAKYEWGSARREQAHQMHGMVPDNLTLGIPRKAAQLQQSTNLLLQRPFDRLTKERLGIYPLTGYGLLLHKLDGVSLFEVQLSPPR